MASNTVNEYNLEGVGTEVNTSPPSLSHSPIHAMQITSWSQCNGGRHANGALFIAGFWSRLAFCSYNGIVVQVIAYSWYFSIGC